MNLKMTEAQKTLYYIAENMKMEKKISDEGYQHFQMAIKALEQQPSEDCVSRQAVKDIIHEYKNNIDSQLSWLSDGVCALPSVTPTFPKGATNGDIIKAMFPNSEIYTDVINEIVDIEICEDSSELRCSVDWWNAPYEEKRGNENG